MLDDYRSKSKQLQLLQPHSKVHVCRHTTTRYHHSSRPVGTAMVVAVDVAVWVADDAEPAEPDTPLKRVILEPCSPHSACGGLAAV